MRSGLLNLDKPRGLTSRRVVDRVVLLVDPAKVGHAGTLDPLATGVLVVCIGAATRLIEYVQRMPKRYRATFLLGRSSPTDDSESEATLLESPPVPSDEELRRAAQRFTGRILQRPPAFSAVHVAGRRAYELARRGESVELEARPVEVYRLDIVRYDYPELVLDIECGSGTYIRALGRDLAESLGTAAIMSALVRTAVGQFLIEEAHPLNELSTASVETWLLPPLAALAGLGSVTLDDSEVRHVLNGQALLREAPSSDRELAAVDQQGQLIAVLKRRDDGSLAPTRVFPQGR